MAWTMYNKGLYEIGKNDISAASLKMLVIAGASVPAGLTNTASYDLNTVADVLGVAGTTEAAVAGYARPTLAGVTFTEDDTNDWAQLGWTNPVWSAMPTGETWRAVVLYRNIGADSANLAWGIDVFAAGVPTNGSDITYSGGALRVTR